MGENSKIEWCHHTFNPWIGCYKVSEGCAHCYAEHSTRARILRHQGIETWGKGAARALTSDDYWKQPLKWNRQAAAAWENWTRAVDARAGDSGPMPTRPRVFCASLADWLDDDVSSEWLARLMELIMLTPHLDWLLLTKRPQNFKGRMNAALKRILKATGGEPCNAADFIDGWVNKRDTIPANVWIGTTVENQARANERIPILLSIPAKVRFLSCEPLLGPLDFWPPAKFPHAGAMTSDWNPKGLIGIHWVIAGGESGPQARPMHPDWARSLRDQCADANVPFFFKQWGQFNPVANFYGVDEEHDGLEPDRCIVMEMSGHQVACVDDRYEHQPRDGAWLFENIGKAKAGRLLDGLEHNGFPNLSHMDGSAA